MSESRPAVCRPLPPELWGQVFSHVDDFTLWVVCRQVSPVLRAEVEREFAKTRLPLLQIGWEFLDCVTFGGWARHLKYQGLTEDSKRVQFSARVGCNIEEGKSARENLRDSVPKILQHEDLEFDLRFSGYDDGSFRVQTWSQLCRLGSYINNLEIPALKVDFQTESLSSDWDVFFSFDWKAFFNAFYHDYAYVQQQLQKHTPSPETPSLTFVQRAIENLTMLFASRNSISELTQEAWINNFRWEEDALFLRAYIKRLKASHYKVGKHFQYDEESKVMVDSRIQKWMRRHIKYRRRAQNQILLEDFMKIRVVRDAREG